MSIENVFFNAFQFRPQEGLSFGKGFRAGDFYYCLFSRWLKQTAKDSTTNEQFS